MIPLQNERTSVKCGLFKAAMPAINEKLTSTIAHASPGTIVRRSESDGSSATPTPLHTPQSNPWLPFFSLALVAHALQLQPESPDVHVPEPLQ
jgi:hypothetical protein